MVFWGRISKLKMIMGVACLLSCLFWGTLPVMAETASRETLTEAVGRLPIGVFAVPRDLLYLGEMNGFEVVHDYHFEEGRDQNDELAAYLDAAQGFGLKVMVGFERKENYTLPKVLERIRRFRAHPALWAWYLYDEPKMEMLTRVQEIAAAIRREDSGHALIIAANETEFAALADKVFAYRYPVKDKSFPLEDLEPFVRRIGQAAVGNIPFCGLIQTFTGCCPKPDWPGCNLGTKIQKQQAQRKQHLMVIIAK
jgi:hypothetical protein